MPISCHKNSAIEETYEKILKLIVMAKVKDDLVILVDWNDVVYNYAKFEVTEKFGLKIRNQRVDRPNEFCKKRDMIIINTLFSQLKQR